MGPTDFLPPGEAGRGLWLRNLEVTGEGCRGAELEGRIPAVLPGGRREEGSVAGRVSPAWQRAMSRMACSGEGDGVGGTAVRGGGGGLPLQTHVRPAAHLCQCQKGSRSEEKGSNSESDINRVTSKRPASYRVTKGN